MNISIEVNILVTDDEGDELESHTFETIEQAQLKVNELEEKRGALELEDSQLIEWRNASQQRMLLSFAYTGAPNAMKQLSQYAKAHGIDFLKALPHLKKQVAQNIYDERKPS